MFTSQKRALSLTSLTVIIMNILLLKEPMSCIFVQRLCKGYEILLHSVSNLSNFKAVTEIVFS